jgi:transcriptional regulator with XRE-family HTH domain
MKNKSSGVLNKKIGLKIMLERRKRTLSQEQLAELTDLSRNTIGQLERGETSPSIDTIERIANAFGMTFQELTDVTKIDL